MMFYFLLILVFLIFFKNAISIAPNGCFDLTQLQMLTFSKNSMTTSTKFPSTKQLNCVEYHSCKHVKSIDSVKCLNSGVDEIGNIQWKCFGSSPSDVDIGTATVSCDECTNQTDFYKVIGSCALFYTPISVSFDGEISDDIEHYQINSTDDLNFGILLLFMFGATIVIVFMLMIMCSRNNDHTTIDLINQTNRTNINDQTNRTTDADSVFINENSSVPITTIRPYPLHSYGSYQNTYSLVPITEIDSEQFEQT